MRGICRRERGRLFIRLLIHASIRSIFFLFLRNSIHLSHRFLTTPLILVLNSFSLILLFRSCIYLFDPFSFHFLIHCSCIHAVAALSFLTISSFHHFYSLLPWLFRSVMFALISPVSFRSFAKPFVLKPCATYCRFTRASSGKVVGMAKGLC